MFELFKRRWNWKTMSGHFRSNVWDPLTIISQIVCMQCFYYVGLGFWIYMLDFIGGFDIALEQMYTQTNLGLYEDTGRTNLIAYVLNSLTCAVSLWFVVRRTKQCLDFSATVYVFHFAWCWIMGGHIPQTFWWWLTSLICLTFMTVLGEFLCMRTELKSIPVTMGPKVDL